MIATILLSTLLLTNDGAADSVLVRYDLSGVLSTYDADPPSESLLFSPGTWQEQYRTSIEHSYNEPDADSVIELLARMFQEEFEYEGRELFPQGDRELLVLAPADVQARVKRALQELEDTLSATVELQIDVLSLPADAPAPFGGRTVVDESELSGLPTSGRDHEQYRLRLRAGRTAAVQNQRDLPLIVDHDVEIAQGAVVHDPVAAFAEAGTRILVRGAPTPSGLALSIFAGHGEPLSSEPLPIDAPLRSFVSVDPDQDDRLIEAPRLQERYEIAFRSAAFDTLLPPGKALVISSSMQVATLRADAGRSREALVIRRVGGEMKPIHRFAMPGSGRELVFVNTQSLREPWIALHNDLSGDEEYDVFIPTLVAEMNADPAVFLVDWIDARFSTWRMIGPWVVCVFDPSWDGDAMNALTSLVGAWQSEERLIEVELRALVDGQTTGSWNLPVRAGTNVGALVGVSTSALVDYDVEVAQGAAAADPQIRPQFAGLALAARASGLAGGGTALDLRALLRHRPYAPRLFPLGGPMMTKLERTPFDVLEVNERVEIAGGESAPRVLGDRGGKATFELKVR